MKLPVIINELATKPVIYGLSLDVWSIRQNSDRGDRGTLPSMDYWMSGVTLDIL